MVACGEIADGGKKKEVEEPREGSREVKDGLGNVEEGEVTGLDVPQLEECGLHGVHGVLESIGEKRVYSLKVRR